MPREMTRLTFHATGAAEGCRRALLAAGRDMADARHHYIEVVATLQKIYRAALAAKACHGVSGAVASAYLASRRTASSFAIADGPSKHACRPPSLLSAVNARSRAGIWRHEDTL